MIFGGQIMKYNKIVLFFCISAPACMLMRILQLMFTVEAETGFFNAEYGSIGYYLLAFIAVFCAVTVILCFTGHRNPEHPPKKNIFICISSLFLAAATAIQLFSESFSGTVRLWQSALLMLTGFGATVFFLIYGISGFAGIKPSPVLAVLPAVYYIMRLICDFTSVSSLALITDNMLVLAAYSLSLLFFISFGKLYNGIDPEYNFRKLMATGMAAVILCLTQSVPYFIINVLTGGVYRHTSVSCNFALLATGIFAAVFIFSHFSYSNTVASHSGKREEKYYI